MEDFEATGKFYKPHDESNTVAGKLTFSAADGIKLTLIGSFDNHPIPKEESCEILFGICTDCPAGNHVTLLDNTHMGSSYANPGIEQEHFSTRLLLCGTHWTEGLATHIKKLEIKTNYLDAWVDTYAYQMSIPRDISKLDDLRITYRPPEHKFIKFNQGQMRVEHGGSIPFGAFRKTTLHDEVKLYVELDRSLQLKTLHKKVVDPIQSFLTFATGNANRITELILFEEGDKDRLNKISVHWDQVVQPKEISDQDSRFLRRSMLITYSQLVNHKANILKRWFIKYPIINKSLTGYFGSMYSSHTYVDTKFISLISAVESFHRAFPGFNNQTDLSKANRIDSICNQLGQVDSDWLRGELRYASEPSLRFRLSELCGVCWIILQDTGIPISQFINAVIDTRNQKLHGLPHKNRRILSGLGMVQANFVLSILIQSLLLYQLGLKPKEIKQAINKTYNIKNIKHFVQADKIKF
ncbi:MAG: hypothetical protein KTR15_15015 [Phycisphaeraceae bacterium]|nr:hypothetical protein [Phycisphaeraceae bacterium]